MTKKMDSATKATKAYIRLQQRVEALQERMAQIKQDIATEYPDGVQTQYGTWQTYSDGVRQSYDNKSLGNLVDELILKGNGELAQRILLTRKESTVQGGIRFVKTKEARNE
jgi:hypothetical protein